MKTVEEIHKEWNFQKSRADKGDVLTEEKRCNIKNKMWFAVLYFDLLLNYIYDRDEYVALLEHQLQDPTFLRDVQPYRPKDLTERKAFMTLWCERCKHLKEACSGHTHLMVLTEDGQAVDYDDLICMPNGQPTCTGFEVDEDAE